MLQWYTGTLALAVAGRAAVPVARYQGIIRTTWTPQADGSFRYRTFDLGFFGDLATGKAQSVFTNPVTGAPVEPLDIRDGPVESVYSVNGAFRDGAPVNRARTLTIPWVQAGDDLWYSTDLVFEYANPLSPELYPELTNSARVAQRSVFTYQGRRSEIEDSRTVRAPANTIMLVVSSIHPWLKMGRVPGSQIIQTTSHKIASIAAAPAEVRDYIERVMPDFLTAETPFRGAGNSYERYRRERLSAPPPAT